jgi:uncharacterized protein (DUF433 family)
LGKNPKGKKPVSKKELGRPPGATPAPSGLEARAPKPRVPEAKTSEAVREAADGNDQAGTDSPRVLDRDGVVYVEGCDVPIWRLEMARRAGCGRAALTAAFPGLTSEGLDLAFAYARRHRAKLDKLIRRQGTAVPARDEGPADAAAFEADLDDLLDHNAEVFRRLAQ